MVLNIDNTNLKDIHKEVFFIMKNSISEEEFNGIVSENEYNSKIYKDSHAYQQQIPFYTTKPLYVYIYWFVYKFKNDLVKSAEYINIFFYFLCFILLSLLLNSKLTYIYSVLLSFIFFTSSFCLNILKLGTPDVLSLFFCILFFLFFKNKKYFYTTLVAIIAILVRNDNLFICVIFPLLGWIIEKNKKYGYIALISLATYFLSFRFFNAYYGWHYSLYHTFVEYISYPKNINLNLSIDTYFNILFSQNGKEEYDLLVITFVLIFFNLIRNNKLEKKTVTYSLILIIIIRFFIFPAIWNRFNLIYFIIILSETIKNFNFNYDYEENKNLAQ